MTVGSRSKLQAFYPFVHLMTESTPMIDATSMIENDFVEYRHNMEQVYPIADSTPMTQGGFIGYQHSTKQVYPIANRTPDDRRRLCRVIRMTSNLLLGAPICQVHRQKLY